MSKERKNKSGSEDRAIKIVIFATAILNLIKALVDLISRLIE